MPRLTIFNQGSNKFQLLDNPVALPHKCAGCGYPGGTSETGIAARQFIDWGITLEYYGAVIFCENCIIEVASVLGFVPPEKIDAALDKITELLAQNQELRLANDSLRTTVHTLSSPIGNVISADSEPDTEPDISDTDTSSSEPEPTKPSSSKRSNVVPDASSNNLHDLGSQLSI